MEIYQYIVSQFFGIIIFLVFLNEARILDDKRHKEGLTEWEDLSKGFSIFCCIIFPVIPVPLSFAINRFCSGF